MTLSIMQPYLFPYIGYFQLMQAADKFVVYDDVNFINRGWINRNRLLINSREFLFSVPIKEASQFRKINELVIDDSQRWREKLLKTIAQGYKKAPHFDHVFQVVSRIVYSPTEKLNELLFSNLQEIAAYLQLPIQLVETSAIYQNHHLKAQERILDICKKEEANRYVNAIGGQELYDKETFNSQGITLQFQQSHKVEYQQFGNDFVPCLSIIDVLMFNSIEQTQDLLKAYNLV